MLEKAIKLIEKQIDLYIIQEKNITTKARKQTVENKVKKALREEIAIRQYILKTLLSKRQENSWTK